jgi:hypothetical protein
MNKEERAAFIRAYLQNGDAPLKYVEDFLNKYYSDQDIEYDEYYTGLMDALSVWCSALRFAKTQKETA